ncbi:hypothetical protein GC089_06030 [Cellulomonas sp. JZ18]|uniref:N-acetylmuramoyl-L-alanine amidase n=1 Tax=Cellulomonas sp. JZ18 TaxID=2654191 RepID=UPI0012D3D48F|nr:N-acetylmuramoyl-L-alanine amidase [Cellulomonas sp. JZ18]QGQ18881.1 hypothetical protein GC089_06030 [Cellulomonas sp. JZ18]
MPTPDVLTDEMDTREFSVLGFTWDPGPTDVTVAFRVREAGEWSDWQPVGGGDVVPDADSLDAARSTRAGTDPVVTTGADGLQVYADSPTGAVTGLRAVLVDPGVLPQDSADAVAAATVAVPGQPAIVERAGWGADESLRPCQPDYSPAMRAVVVHHTASANGYSADAVPGIIRGFYAYHVQSRGWCDIGYNVLVDRFGRVFEGRAGGLTSTVVGVHTGGFNSRTVGVAAIGDYGSTGVPGALLDGLVSVISWKAAIHNIPGDQQVTLVSGGGDTKFPAGTPVSFHTIFGHRDAQYTSCPGQNLYDLLPTIRARVAAAANAAVAATPVGNWEQLDTTPSSLTVSGWALARGDTSPLSVVVRVDGRPTTITADQDRPDIGAAYPGSGSRHGFALTLPQTPGRHVVCVEVVRPGGVGVVALGCRTADVVNRAPLGAVDVLRLQGRTLQVSGWTFDPDTRESTSVHVYVGARGAVVPADRSRPDVGAAYRRGDRHGFEYTTTVPEGRHTVCVYGIDSAGGPPTVLRCTDVQVGASPVGALEAVTLQGTTLRASGWAFDPDDDGPGTVHLYVDGRGTALTADVERRDVGTAYGRDPRVGFTATSTVGAGRHEVCAWAIDSGGAPPVALGCRTVEVRDAAPVGVLESVNVSGRSVVVQGWAFDPDSAGPTSVHVYVGATGVAVAADLQRTDVGTAYARDPRTGFTATGALQVGANSVCAYAINTGGAPHALLGCREVVLRDAPPVGALERVEWVERSGGAVDVWGWAFDPDLPGPTDVHVYVNGRGIARAATWERTDVGRAYGRDPRVGFYVAVPVARREPQEVCVYAINGWGAPHTSLGCRVVVG